MCIKEKLLTPRIISEFIGDPIRKTLLINIHLLSVSFMLFTIFTSKSKSIYPLKCPKAKVSNLVFNVSKQ